MPFFKRNPSKRIKKAYEQKMKAAMEAMRKGDVKLNAELFAEAETLKAELTRLEQAG